MYKYLDKINSPEDLKKLNIDELKFLCEEIRDFLINTISQTGGHLASNLGVVELTVAIHYVYDSPKDKLIWDVGHQSYIHKILTGRKDLINTIRKTDGLSGFIKRSESSHDVFEAGHSSTSISAALGIARARDLAGEHYDIAAIIGDGALTGGMALEALNEGGKRKSKMTVILNENEMSISENVGAISNHLNKLRTNKSYYKFKEKLENLLSKIPGIGNKIIKLIRKIKEGLKTTIVNGGMFFEELGYRYIGPVDGHDVESIVQVLKKIKEIDNPVLLHVCTVKGKGYKLAEENPDLYHGVGNFDVAKGQSINTKKITFSSVFGNKLTSIAEKNKNVVAITAAMKDGTGLNEFAAKYPERFFDVGIAEQHGVTLAAGMASNGLVPVFAVYSTFLQRAYDQIIHDVAMQNLHVVFGIDRAGIVGKDGETHQGVFDTSFLTNIPNITVFTPGDYQELEKVLEYSINNMNSPVAVRYPRGSVKDSLECDYKNFNPFENEVLKEGKDLTIVTHGRMTQEALKAANRAEKDGVNCEVIYMRCIKPLDLSFIIKSSNKTGHLLIIDESLEDTSIKDRISVKIYKENKNINIDYLTLPNKFIEHGTVEDILDRYQLSEKGIYEKIMSLK
ncbi:MAG TPA: 1-deoxy-D-xylulose-5-phosphate synthase [Clostridiales bacterium]|nr:1-deoxy-D-xylulose-5-phosphate synthase [Clostridiales bacterium]